MTNWLFQLGRETELCRLELANLARVHGYGAIESWNGFAQLSAEDDTTLLLGFVPELGGTLRVIREVGTWSLDAAEGEWFQPSGAWALSALEPGLGSEREEIRGWIRQRVKADEELHGREVRAAPGEFEVSPAKVSAENLADREAEFCLWKNPAGEVRVGRTAWVFSTEEFSTRDVKKPVRPRRRGLLPPKLARQMVNLARTEKGGKLLDPFCGSGVVLMEGLSLGLAVAGSDNRDEALDQTRKNLGWFLNHNHEIPRENHFMLERLDVRQLTKQIEPLSLDMVVGEGDLGPPIRGSLSRKEAIGFVPKLEELYVAAFAEIRIVLKPGGRVCLAVPFWRPNEGDPILLNLKRRLELMGYVPAIPEKGFDPILYSRKDQKVGRAIYVLESPE